MESDRPFLKFMWLNSDLKLVPTTMAWKLFAPSSAIGDANHDGHKRPSGKLATEGTERTTAIGTTQSSPQDHTQLQHVLHSQEC